MLTKSIFDYKIAASKPGHETVTTNYLPPTTRDDTSPLLV